MVHTLRLGIFIVSTLILLAVGTFLIGQRQFLFTPTYDVKTNFKNVTGLTEGAEVRVGGIHQGIVKHITLPEQPNGDMTVVMSLDRSTRKVLRSDSVASIGSEGLLGSKYVDITFGSEKGAALESEATIASKPPVDLNEMVEKAGDAMQKAGSALGDVRGQMARVTSQAAQGAAAFTENMEAMRHNFFLKGFFNDRGYEDSTKLADHLIKQAPRGAPAQTFSFDVRKIFADLEHAKLKGQKTLNPAGQYLQDNPFESAVVVAVSGLKGDSEELETMLQARAWVVRDYLVSNFRMDDKRVKTMVRGKSAAKTDDGTVEVLVYRK